MYISSLCFFSHLPPLLLLKTVSSSEPELASTMYLYVVWHTETQVPAVVPVCCWNINNKPLFSFTNSNSASFDTSLVVLCYFTRSQRHFRECTQSLPTSYPTDVRTEPQWLQLSLGWSITRNKSRTGPRWPFSSDRCSSGEDFPVNVLLFVVYTELIGEEGLLAKCSIFLLLKQYSHHSTSQYSQISQRMCCIYMRTVYKSSESLQFCHSLLLCPLCFGKNNAVASLPGSP